MAEKLKVCVPSLHPILFNFRASDDNSWVMNLAGCSGRHGGGRIDGVSLLESILREAKEDHGVDTLTIPKKAVIIDASK